METNNNESNFFNYDVHEFMEIDPGEMVNSYEYYVDGIALTIVSTIGVIGSLMSIVVLLKARIRDFFSSFLTALSVFDCLFLVLAIPYIGLPAISIW
jgi:hypothetical protein